jgi:predicted exporter
VSNALPHPVSVLVTIRPQRPLIRVIENQVLLEIEPDATKTAFIPVEAIANGVVTIQVELTSPTGVPVDSGFVRARLQAEWETVGTVVVVVIIALIFGLGIARTIVKRRRAKNSVGESAVAETDAVEGPAPESTAPEASEERTGG